MAQIANEALVGRYLFMNNLFTLSIRTLCKYFLLYLTIISIWYQITSEDKEILSYNI